jgi:hypothetical protein
MSKCKVVDMSTMSKEDQEKAMEQHAAGGKVATTPRETAPQVAPSASPVVPDIDNQRAREKPSFHGVGKGFLSGRQGRNLYDENGSPEGSSSVRGKADALFDSLVAGIDPDYAEASKPLPGESSRDTFNALGDIAAMLTGGRGTPPLRNARSRVGDTSESMEPLRGLDVCDPRPRLPASPLAYDVTFAQDPACGDKSCRVTVKFPKEENVDPASVVLETSADVVRVKTPGKPPLDVAVQFQVGQIRAKFSKKRAELAIQVRSAERGTGGP